MRDVERPWDQTFRNLRPVEFGLQREAVAGANPIDATSETENVSFESPAGKCPVHVDSRM